MVTLEITNNYETPVIIGEYIAKVYDKRYMIIYYCCIIMIC